MSQISNDGDKYDIFNFLEEHIVEKGQTYTHTSMGKPHGAYYIKDSEIDIFYQLYEKAIFDNKDLHITEKHDEFGPMLVDLDFKYELETFERKHGEIHIKKIVELYINEICSLFNIEKNDKRLHCFVFEREQIYKTKGITKDGVHLMFPKIISYPQEQYYIRENVLKKIGEILKDLPLTNIMSDVVDRSIIYNNGWLLYGSKKPKCDPYQITYLFDGIMNKINIEDYDFGPHSLPKFFAIRNKKDSDIISIRDDKKHLIESSTSKKKIIKPKTTTFINYDIDKIKEFVLILNDERAEGYTSWLELGWALHNIDPNSQELLDIWIDFSKKSSKFTEGVCEKEWEKSKNEGLSLATIRYWAKLDNFEKYKEIVQNDVNKYIEISVKSQSNYDIAMVLYVMYRYEFKYCKNEWFVYRNHLWHREPDGISLRKKISTELVEQYMKLISHYNKISTDPNINMTDEEKDELKKKSKSPFEISTKLLKTSSFKDCIMKECRELFYDKDFVDKLDSNPFLLSFKNGIYDLKKGELRDGRPDDHVEMSTEIEKIDFDESNEYWEELKGFLNTVFFEEEMRNYFLTYFASCLQGHNAEEKIRIWNGQGSNGKSKILELFVHALGNYSIKFPITMLTGKRAASNAATPEMARAKGKRFGYLEEPSEGEKIDAGYLKELTGGDKITARPLHKDPIDFKPQFKLALLCNEIPKVPPNDSGTWRRMEVIEFKSRFCENPKEANEFPIDKQLSEKLKNWKELFMSLLLDVYYEKYKKIGIKVPLDVIKFTLEYQKQCDLYTDFIHDNIDDTKEDSDVIDITQLYDEFKVWYEDTFSNHKYPSKIEFRNYLKKKYSSRRITTKNIKGFKFKVQYEKKNTMEINLMQGY
jgi:P4 family phage/plasmid primase-like protien